MNDSLAQVNAAQQATTSERRPSPRIHSVDAVRGLVMFTMIFVNDIAGVSDRIVPPWMKHFHGRSGMTFVDLVFPAFLFIVGMSIPLALGTRLSRGEPVWKTIIHVVTRTLSLLFIGILMVNETPDTVKMGWSGSLWCTLMYLCAIFAFSHFSPPTAKASKGPSSRWRIFNVMVRSVAWAGLICLALVFRGKDGHRIVAFAPFALHTSWYGILGLIGWAYLVGALIFLAFRTDRTALLGSMVLLMSLYAAGRTGAFDHFWLNHYVGIGGTLGSQAAITVAGLLLGTILVTPETNSAGRRTRFTLFLIAGCSAGALLLHGLYGINKNSATPSWCLWACAISAALWLFFYFICDVRPLPWIANPLVLAGQNVFLAYLLSDLLPSAIDFFHVNGWYGALAEPSLAHAVARSAGCGIFILGTTVLLNRLGFRLRL